MGLMQRRKGRRFEQWVATQYRKRYINATVRRALQAHQPYEPDVVVEGDAPDIVKSLWTECEDAAEPNPRRKMEQAERDIQKAMDAGCAGRYLPVVVWHRTGCRTRNASLRISDLLVILGYRVESGGGVLLTMDFEHFLGLLPGG